MTISRFFWRVLTPGTTLRDFDGSYYVVMDRTEVDEWRTQSEGLDLIFDYEEAQELGLSQVEPGCWVAGPSETALYYDQQDRPYRFNTLVQRSAEYPFKHYIFRQENTGRFVAFSRAGVNLVNTEIQLVGVEPRSDRGVMARASLDVPSGFSINENRLVQLRNHILDSSARLFAQHDQSDTNDSTVEITTWADWYPTYDEPYPTEDEDPGWAFNLKSYPVGTRFELRNGNVVRKQGEGEYECVMAPRNPDRVGYVYRRFNERTGAHAQHSNLDIMEVYDESARFLKVGGL